MSCYETRIRVEAAALGRPDANARHLEAWMRLKCPAIEQLSARQFRAELAIAIRCVDKTRTDGNEALARCFGLAP